MWVLVIKNSKPTDSGIYVCEVNSNPIVRSFHKLSVLSKALLPPNNTTDLPYSSQKQSFSSKNHNYTDCCMNRNVSLNCLGFCNIQSILEGNITRISKNFHSQAFILAIFLTLYLVLSIYTIDRNTIFGRFCYKVTVIILCVYHENKSMQ